jgi:D-alanine-D-alanine ligase
MNKKKIGLLFGGRSSEHEISILSARSVYHAFDQDKFELYPIYITQKGHWVEGLEILSDPRIKGRTASKQFKESSIFCSMDPQRKGVFHLTGDLHEIDVFFPLIHGATGEDGALQGAFECSESAYVGSSILGSAICLDKVIQKILCEQADIPAAPYLWFRSFDWKKGGASPSHQRHLSDQDQESILSSIEKKLGFPVFVKPSRVGSSIGIQKANDKETCKKAVEEAFRFDHKVIVEKAVANVRELEVSVLGNENPENSVVGEIKPSNEFYDYKAKYEDAESKLEIPAKLDEKLANQIRKLAIKAYQICECEGLARIDFLLDNQTKEVILNEINTIPGFTQISMYPKLWEASGVNYKELITRLIEFAVKKSERQKKLERMGP